MTMESVCAETGRKITERFGNKKAKKAETIVRDGLGVARVDGMYALYLYLRYKDKDGGLKIWEEISSLLKTAEVGSPLGTAKGDDVEKVIEMTESLYKVLLARQLCERALTYALYGLRTKGA